MSVIQKYDTGILEFIRIHFHSNILDILMPFITSMGNGGLVWIGIALILIFNKNYRRAGFMVIGSLLLCSLLGDIVLKHLIQRPRPFLANIHPALLIPEPTTFSFPSGHTASSFAAALVLGKVFLKYRIHFLVLAALIAFSRMYLYVHYPTDIIGGIILGFVCSKIIFTTFSYKKSKTAL